MSLGFDIVPVIALLAAGIPQLQECKGAAELASAVKSTTVRTPTAFVLPAKEVAAPASPASQQGIQAVDAQFGVVYAVRNYQVSQLGAAQNEQLLAIRRAGFAALVGWQPPGYDQVRRVEYGRGQLLAYDAATVWWQDIFRTRYWSRS